MTPTSPQVIPVGSTSRTDVASASTDPPLLDRHLVGHGAELPAPVRWSAGAPATSDAVDEDDALVEGQFRLFPDRVRLVSQLKDGAGVFS